MRIHLRRFDGILLVFLKIIKESIFINIVALIMNYFICLIFTLISCISFAQDQGGLRGTIMEDFSQEPIKHAYVSLQTNGALVAQTRADANGAFLFVNIDAGSYDLIISKFGLSPLKITDVFITPNELSELNPTFEAGGFDQDTIVLTYSELQQPHLIPNAQTFKKCSYKKQWRAARKLEK